MYLCQTNQPSSYVQCINQNISLITSLIYVPPGLSFKQSTFCPHRVFMGFTSIFVRLYPRTYWLVFITETECVYSAVRTECSNITQINLKVQIHVRVWLANQPRGAWLGSQARIYFTTVWQSTHWRVWLIGTRASPAGLASKTRTCMDTFSPEISTATHFSCRTRGVAECWGSGILVSLEFCIHLILPATLWPWFCLGL
jgi:hypothetical protein